MLPYPYHIFIFVSSHLISHELYASLCYHIFIFVSSYLISHELYASLCYISCYLVSRLGCWSLKYRGSVDPSMCVVQFKALILLAHI